MVPFQTETLREVASMPNYDWKVFDKRTAPLVKRPEVTVQAKGTLSMNASAYHALGEPKAVELLYDPAETVIGIRPVPEDEPHAYPIRPVASGSTYVISGSAFFAWFEIPLVAPRRRDVAVDQGVLIIDLKDPGRDATSNRNRSKMRAASQNGAGNDTGAAALAEVPSQ